MLFWIIPLLTAILVSFLVVPIDIQSYIRSITSPAYKSAPLPLPLPVQSIEEPEILQPISSMEPNRYSDIISELSLSDHITLFIIAVLVLLGVKWYFNVIEEQAEQREDEENKKVPILLDQTMPVCSVMDKANIEELQIVESYSLSVTVRDVFQDRAEDSLNEQGEEEDEEEHTNEEEEKGEEENDGEGEEGNHDEGQDASSPEVSRSQNSTDSFERHESQLDNLSSQKLTQAHARDSSPERSPELQPYKEETISFSPMRRKLSQQSLQHTPSKLILTPNFGILKTDDKYAEMSQAGVSVGEITTETVYSGSFTNSADDGESKEESIMEVSSLLSEKMNGE